jgi:hypothetical protein
MFYTYHLAYGMKGESGRDALMGSIQPLLELIYFQPPKPSAKGKKPKKVTWPVVKMIQYVCSTVDTGKPDDATVVRAEDNATEEDTQLDVNNTTSVSVADEEAVQCNSTSLLAGLQVAEFLSKRSEDLNVTSQRALCKLLGGSFIDIEEEDPKNLAALKRFMEELGMLISDGTSLRSLATLNDVLSEIEVDEESLAEEEEEEEVDSAESLDDEETEYEEEEDDDALDVPPIKTTGINLSDDLMTALSNVKITDSDDAGINLSDDKENVRRSSGGRKKQRKSSTGSANSLSSRRSRLKRLSDTSVN